MSQNTTQLAVLPRPRTPWQAIDAGMLLARAHYWKLVVLWLVFALPIALVAFSVILFDVSPYITVLIMWWFKPLSELPILMYLSRVFFNQPASVRGSLKDALKRIPRLLVTYLSFSRLSPSRSMTAPVVFLEQLKRKARRNRVSVLLNEDTQAFPLLLAWLHIEGIGFYVLFGLFLSMAQHGYDIEQILAIIESDAVDLKLFETLVYAALPSFIAVLAAPMYVGSGFMLYINRRIRLEAWDIEHQFQHLQNRHKNSDAAGRIVAHLSPWVLFSALTATVVFSISHTTPSYAQSASSLPTVNSIRQETQEIYSDADFGYTEIRRTLVFKEPAETDEPKERPNIDYPNLAKFVALILIAAKYLIYLGIGLLLVLILWTIARVLPDSWQFGLNKHRKPKLELLSDEHHPLTKSLPENIAEAARQALAQGSTREAFSLLYRGALRYVMQSHDISIPKSATENECLLWVSKCDVPEHINGFKKISSNWSGVAYARQKPTASESEALVEYWESQFNSRTEAPS